MLNSFSNDFATFWIEDSVLHFVYHSSVKIDLAAAEKIVSDRVKFQEEKILPVLCDVRGLKEIDKEARDYLAKEGSLMASAVAVLVNPPLSKAMTDFYIQNSKPVVPTRPFTDKYEALKYLKNIRK